MTDEYEKHEIACQEIRAENATILEEFVSWLQAKGLSETTVRKHSFNIDFYINEYLLYEDVIRAADGAYSVGMFLGYWFIRKAMWASKASIRSNATSLKKFYQFMVERGLVGQKSLDALSAQIKHNMANWLESLRRYDDPSFTDPAEVWGFYR